jgi:hypothetical protein
LDSTAPLVNGVYVADTDRFTVNVPRAGLLQLAALAAQDRRTAASFDLRCTDTPVPASLRKAAAEGLATLLNYQDANTPSTSTVEQIAADLTKLGLDEETASVVAGKLAATSSAVKPATEQFPPERTAELITTALARANFFNEAL